MALKIRHLYSERSERWEVKLMGELDIDSSTALKERLSEILEEKTADVIVNAEDLEYIDSTGLGMLIGVIKQLKSKGKELIIVNPQDSVSKLFRITGLDKVFTLREE